MLTLVLKTPVGKFRVYPVTFNNCVLPLGRTHPRVSASTQPIQTLRVPLLQAFNLIYGAREKSVLDQISRHFDRVIPDVKYDNDDAFEKVLQEAGLMSRDA
jgi:hypothetical protein